MQFRHVLLACLSIAVVHAQGATLRHRYPLDGNGNDIVGTADLSVRGNGVTFPGSGGAIGGYVQLAGSNDYLLASLDEGSTLSILGDYSTFRPFSVSFWVKQTPEQADAATQAVFGMTTDSTDPSTYNTGFEVITRENGQGIGLRVRARNAGANDNAGEINTGIDVSDGEWHHVAVAYDQDIRRVYVDGVFRGSNSVSVPILTNPIRYFALGAFLRAGQELDDFKGAIDDVQIYEGLLSEAQAKSLYETPGSTVDGESPEPEIPLADVVDPMIGAADTGSCPPGPALPHASILPSPDTNSPLSSGYRHGNDVVGFSQLHPQGAGSSTLSYGNFLIAPKIGSGYNETSHRSPISGIQARPYSFRGRLTKWAIDCTVVPSRRSAIYQFDFPASNDSRIYLDVARKLGRSDGMTSGTVTIDPVNGTISGGGTFDGNWNPAPYEVFFYAKIDRTPTVAGTWVGTTESAGVYSASISTRQRLGAWMRFDTTTDRTVRMKIAVSFDSVEKARQYLEAEIPGWDIGGLEQAAKEEWNRVLSVVQAPGISAEEGRKLYTALFHSLIQPRNRTGDPAGWPGDAPFWDDHYTNWDTWLTLFPLLGILQPETMASVVNSYGERFARNGRAETAFIQGKDFQVGQGGDEGDLVIADAWAKQIPGIDWEKVWPLLEFNANRRTPDYRDLGFVSSDGNRNGYDSRMRSGSSTLAFAYEDWTTAQIAAGLGHTEFAAQLLARSGNWRNVWDDSATSNGFTGFVRARARNGDFSTSSLTSSNDFYQGTSWNYSLNVPHERDAMIEKMGGRARFLQRLDFAFRQNSTAYIDYTNEVCFQSTWLFAHAGRPFLTSYWADRLRKNFGPYSFPGDEDSGAMSSLYFFTTAGFFPIAGQDFYYLHGPRIPRLEFHQSNGNTFVITAENAGGDNIYIQSVTLNGQPLHEPVIRHSDIVAGGVLAFVMGPTPTLWGTGTDFTPDPRELVLPVKGTWLPGLGSPEITNPTTDAPSWTVAPSGTAIYSPVTKVTLEQPGDAVTLTATLHLAGDIAAVENPSTGIAWGLFEGGTGTTDWPGYLAATDTNGSGAQSFWRKTSDAPFHSAAGTALSTCSLVPPHITGPCRLTLTLRRTASGGLDFFASLVRENDGALISSFTGSDPTPATFTFDRVGIRIGGSLHATSAALAGCTVLATRTDYDGRDLFIPEDASFLLGDETKTLRNLVNHGLLQINGGKLTVNGTITNTGTIRVKRGGKLDVQEGIQNEGTLDTISSPGGVTGPLENTGTLLGRDALRLDIGVTGDDNLTLTFPAYEGHDYALQIDESRRLEGPWTNLGALIPGTGDAYEIHIPGGATADAAFYRIVPDP